MKMITRIIGYRHVKTKREGEEQCEEVGNVLIRKEIEQKGSCWVLIKANCQRLKKNKWVVYKTFEAMTEEEAENFAESIRQKKLTGR